MWNNRWIGGAVVVCCLALLMMSCGGGEQLQPSPSPSATPTPSATATPSPTPSPTASPTPAPSPTPAGTVRILFLHHSTGGNIWGGGVSQWFSTYNTSHGTDYRITEHSYPDDPYPWANYPYDYWNLWVNPNGPSSTTDPDIYDLETLVSTTDVIVFKHCFPVSNIAADTGSASVSSQDKRAENYKLQYAALKTKLNSFPGKKFIVWTGAALAQGQTNAQQGQRARDFFHWVKTTWDQPSDNIYIWDFFELETEGGNYLKAEYTNSGDSHPNATFSATVAPYFGRRVVNVIEGRGDTSRLDGKD